MKYLRTGLLILVAVQIVVLFILLGIVVYSYYDNKVEIVEKDDILIENIESQKQEEVILPDIDKLEEENTNQEEIKDIVDEYVKEDAIYKEEQKKDEIYNILLAGVDTRGNSFYSRSDSMILLSYNKTDHVVKMVSFLRDSYVYLPERGWGRINSATAYGGIGLLVNTINENFDLDIQNYVQIRFNDFKKVIDILGGVDIELTQSEINYINNKLHTDDNDWKNDVKAQPGMVHLNGVQTLWHCRNRTIGEGDFSRTDRQREVLTIIMNNAMNMSPTQLISLIYEMKDHVDMNVPLDLLIEIVEDALISKNLVIESYRVPFDGMYSYANKNGASVLEIDIEGITEELHKILGFTEEEVIEENIETETVSDEKVS